MCVLVYMRKYVNLTCIIYFHRYVSKYSGLFWGTLYACMYVCTYACACVHVKFIYRQSPGTKKNVAARPQYGMLG